MENKKVQSQNIQALRNKWQSQKAQVQSTNNNFSIYGITKNAEPALKLCLTERTGKRTYVPYSFQPVFVFDPESNITIKTTAFKIVITGRGLDTLCEYLANDTLLWLNESSERLDNGEEPIYIENIEYEGLLSDE